MLINRWRKASSTSRATTSAVGIAAIAHRSHEKSTVETASHMHEILGSCATTCAQARYKKWVESVCDSASSTTMALD